MLCRTNLQIIIIKRKVSLSIFYIQNNQIRCQSRSTVQFKFFRCVNVKYITKAKLFSGKNRNKWIICRSLFLCSFSHICLWHVGRMDIVVWLNILILNKHLTIWINNWLKFMNQLRLIAVYFDIIAKS